MLTFQCGAKSSACLKRQMQSGRRLAYAARGTRIQTSRHLNQTTSKSIAKTGDAEKCVIGKLQYAFHFAPCSLEVDQCVNHSKERAIANQHRPLNNCGHCCMANCHSELLHSSSECREPCERALEYCGHPCRKRCGEPCGPCTVAVSNLLLPCGHTRPARSEPHILQSAAQ